MGDVVQGVGMTSAQRTYDVGGHDPAASKAGAHALEVRVREERRGDFVTAKGVNKQRIIGVGARF